MCAGGVCQLCAAARSRRLLIKQAVLPPNPDQTTRARCCRLVLGAYLANFSGFFFALFFFSRPLLLDTPKADKAMRLGVLESRCHLRPVLYVPWGATRQVENPLRWLCQSSPGPLPAYASPIEPVVSLLYYL